MPPRKSNVSTTSAAEDGQAAGSTPAKEREGVNIEDLSLPRSMVSRIAKGVLPPNILLSKDVVLAMQKSATVFISYLAAQANTATMSNNRRTVPPPAIFEALNEIEYEAFIPRVQAELDRFIDIQSSKRNDYRKKLKENKEGTGGAEGSELPSNMDVEMEEGEGVRNTVEESMGRGSKRMRVSEGGDSVRAGGGDASPSDQLMQTLKDMARKHIRPEGESDGEDGEDEEEEDDGQGGGKGDDDEGGEEESEEDEDDEDEYPDEGHRAESLEMEEADADADYGRRRSAYGPGGEGGGGDSSDSDDDEDMDEE